MVGTRLRALRQARGWSLTQLSRAAGVSAGLLSQVERGQTDPSLDTLRKLAKALDVPLFSLFQDVSAHAVSIVRRERRLRVGPSADRVAYSRISPGYGRLEVLEGHLPPGGTSSEEPWEHASEECAVVLSGVLTVEVEGTRYRLDPGDSIYFDSRRPHRYVNDSQAPCTYLVAVTPPSF